MLKTVTHVESYVKVSRCGENVYVRHVENRVEVQKKIPSHFTAHVEIVGQISFFKFDFTHFSDVRHMYVLCYLCKMWCPLNLVFENWKYLWFY